MNRERDASRTKGFNGRVLACLFVRVKRATWELGEVGFLSLTEIGRDRGTCWRRDLRQGFFLEFGPAPRRVGFVCKEMEGSDSVRRRGFGETLACLGDVECVIP
jgi:hypothetical protein